MKLISIILSGIFFYSPARLRVTVSGIQTGKGTIVIAVYTSQQNFFKYPVATKTVKAVAQTQEFSFDLPEGMYAVAVYQDINENKALDKGWFNIPKEPYALSNDFRPAFSAPTFNDCVFHAAGVMGISLALK